MIVLSPWSNTILLQSTTRNETPTETTVQCGHTTKHQPRLKTEQRQNNYDDLLCVTNQTKKKLFLIVNKFLFTCNMVHFDFATLNISLAFTYSIIFTYPIPVLWSITILQVRSQRSLCVCAQLYLNHIKVIFAQLFSLRWVTKGVLPQFAPRVQTRTTNAPLLRHCHRKRLNYIANA